MTNNTCFLYLKNLTIYNANAIANIYTIGLPSLTGFVGYSHVLARHLKNTHPTIKVTGIAPIFHRTNLQNSHPKYISYQNNSDHNKSSSTIDERTVHLSCDLIFRLEINGDELLEEFKNFVRNETSLTNFLYSQPLCGGKIKPNFDNNRVVFINNKEDLFKALKKTSSLSFMLEDYSHLLKELKPEHKDNLDTLLDFIKINKNMKSTDNIEEKKSYAPYCVPINIGFHALEEEPKQRTGARSNQHIYAEPVLGLARVRTVASVRLRKDDEKKPGVFWNYSNNVSKNLFLITAQPWS